MSDIDMNDLLPAFRGEPPLMGACRVFARDAANSQHAMTLAHLVAVLAALTPEQRHDVIGQARGPGGASSCCCHDVLRAAVAWWRKKRPVSFDQAEHIANPTINTTTPAEKRLAKVVASCVAPKEQDA